MKPVSVAEHNNHQPRLHSPTPASATKISIPISSSEAALFGKGRYKVWALAAIALLALWSMFAASVTLRLSSVDLATTFGDASDPLIDELDPLEMEQREKLVRRMWDVYTRTDNHLYLRLLACQSIGLRLSNRRIRIRYSSGGGFHFSV
uniref:Uncharacterized protein n=1 Tax=Zea mays TaxID=4577 RepID=A0A804MSQ7_MAIZE